MPDAALSWAAPAGAWLVTYLVHSTILIGLAWIATRWLDRKPRVADKLWKAALIGGLVTASVQVGVGIQPVTGRVDIGDAQAPPTRLEADVVATERNQPVERVAFEAEPSEAEPSEGMVGFESSGESSSGTRAGVIAIALACWIGLAVALLGVIASTWMRLRRRLRGRREIVSGPLRETLSRLANEAGYRRPIRLTASYDIDVPIAIGIRQREICLPERALYRLNQDQRDTMLAHELAHLLRRDPEWRIAALGVRTVLFVQPLNRLASRRMEQASEDLCDDWAVERTSRPLALARCLTEVAEWMKAGPRILRSIPAMANHGSGLGRRVRRLVAKTTGSVKARRALWVTPAIVAVLAALVFAAPGAKPAYADAGADIAATFAQRMPAPSHDPVEPPTKDSVRDAVAGLFPKARGKRSAPAAPPTPSWPTAPDLPSIPDLGDAKTFEDLIEEALEDVLGGDFDVNLDIDLKVDEDEHSLDIVIDGPDFDVSISLSDMEVDLDIPGLGMLEDVLEEQLEDALRELSAPPHSRQFRRDLRKAERKLRDAERTLREQWRKHRRDHRRSHRDCALPADPFAM